MSHEQVEPFEYAEDNVHEDSTVNTCELEKLETTIQSESNENDASTQRISEGEISGTDQNENEEQIEVIPSQEVGKDSCDAAFSTVYDNNNLVSTVESRSSGNGLNKFDTSVLRIASGKLHSPFYWQVDLNIRSYGNHEIDLLTDSEEMFQETSFTFRRFVVHLIKCYHNFFKRLMYDSKRNLEEMEGMLSFTARKESSDVLFNTIKAALLHVSHSCRVYILERTNQIEKATQILKKIVPYELMNDSNKAGIWGIRAAVYVEYGYEGVKKAIEYASKAIELDSKNAYWHFFKGVYLGRLRRMEKGPVVPKGEEINCLELAMKKNKDPAFYAFTAEVYVDVWKAVEKLQKRNKIPTTDDMKEKLTQHLDSCKSIAAKYFKESVEMRPNSAHLLFRCGKGLMRLPPPYHDLEKAEKYLEKGLELSPKSSFGNHAMATFMMKYMKNNEKAKQYLANAVGGERGNFQAHMDLWRILYLESRDTEDLISNLTEMLKLYGEIPKKCKILGELIICYLFLVYDLEEACTCATHLIELQSELQGFWLDYINDFNSGIFPFSQNVPLIEVLLSETGNQFHRNDITEKERNVYKKFLHFIIAQPCSRLPNPPKNIWSIYAQDLKQELQKRANFVKSCDKKEKCLSKEEPQVTNFRTSSNNEYRKYYGRHEKKTISDILYRHTSDDNDHEKERLRGHRKGRKHDVEKGQSEVLRQNERSPRRKKPSGPREEGANFKSSSKKITEDVAALAINETNISVAEKVEVFLANSKESGCDVSYYTAKKFLGNNSKSRSEKYNKNDNYGDSDRESRKSHRNNMKSTIIPRSSKFDHDSDASTNRKTVLSGRNKEESRKSEVNRKHVKSSRPRKSSDSSSSPYRDSRGYRADRERKYRDSSSSDRDGGNGGRSSQKYLRRQREKRSCSPNSHNRKYKSKHSYASESDSGESTHTRKQRTRCYSLSDSGDEFRYRYKHQDSPRQRDSREKRSYREYGHRSDELKYDDDCRREFKKYDDSPKHFHQSRRDR